MAENFPYLEKEKDIYVKKIQTVAKKMNLKRTTLRHIKMVKVKNKERILNAIIGKKSYIHKKTHKFVS